jgi:hypothetical protein
MVEDGEDSIGETPRWAMGLTVVKTVPTEVEAEMACALLCSAGIRSGHRVPDIAQEGFWGWREIVVAEDDLEAARELLASPQPPE